MTLVYVVNDIHENTALMQRVMGEFGDVVKSRAAVKKGREKQHYILLEVKASSEKYDAICRLLDALPEVSNAYRCQEFELDSKDSLEEEWPRVTLGSISQGIRSDTSSTMRPAELPAELIEHWPRVTLGSFAVKYAEERVRQVSNEWPRITLGSVADVSTGAATVKISGEQRDAQLADMLNVWPRITQATVV